MHLVAAMLVWFSGQGTPLPVPPPPPPVRLTAGEDAALRPVVAAWLSKRAVPASPIVVVQESLPLYPQIGPTIRLELLRHGLQDSIAERLLQSLLRRNNQTGSLESAALEGATRLRFIDILLRGMDPKTSSDPALKNLGQVVAIAIPGTADDSAIVFYAAGPKMTNTMYADTRVAFVKGGVLRWEQQFDQREFPFDISGDLPHQADFTADDRAVIEAVLDRQFPDRTRPLLMINETTAVGPGNQRDEMTASLLSRNRVRVYIPALTMGRPLSLVPRERFSAVRSSELGGAAGIVAVVMPGYTADRQHARIVVRRIVPRKDGIELGSSLVTLDRETNGWGVVSDQYSLESFTGEDTSGIPLRVGGDVKAPVLAKRVEPQFPSGTARQTMILEVTVGADGRVKNVQVLKSAGAAADKAAVDAVRQWEFHPGTLNGKPVPVLHDVALSVP